METLYLLSITIILGILCIYVSWKSKLHHKKNQTHEKNIRISALSYMRIPKHVPEKELLYYFLKNDEKIKRYMDSNLDIKTLNKPVYAVKKYSNGRIEYELYFYRYKPDRDSHIIITHDSWENFISPDELKRMNPMIQKCKLFNSKFIICSFDVNNESIEKGSKEINFYYGPGNTVRFPYYVLEEDENGDIVKTNEYGLIDEVMPKQSQKRMFLNKFVIGDEIVFYAKKPKTKTECVYIENLSKTGFVKFLNYFGYTQEFILFCEETYTDDYKFCVSYDLDLNGQVIKSTIFSLLN